MQASDNSLIVSGNQAKGTLVKVLFEPRAKLSDSVTYDITAWSLPYAYGLDALATASVVKSDAFVERSPKSNDLNKDAYAFLTDWNSMEDARFLAALIQKKIRVRYAMKPFTMDGKAYKRGSLIITRADNKKSKKFLLELTETASEYDKIITPTSTGFVEGGKDFGSGYVQMIPEVKVAILSGEPTSTLRFGEIWHFFEKQLNYPVAVIDSDYMSRIDLSDYGVLILPDGYGYNSFINESRLAELKEWVSSGGKLIAMGGAIKSLTRKEGFSLKAKESIKDSTVRVQAYESSERDRIKEVITGAIFKTIVDKTHPLAFGYDDTYFTLKLGVDAYDYLDNGSVVYLEETNTEPVSGFAGSDAQKKIGNTLVFGVESHGRGSVIYMVDNPLFRGFWENGKLFFANALFMVN